jgi:hypothetical protein
VVKIEDIWYAGTEADWKAALQHYWSAVKPANIDVEREMEKIDPNVIARMTPGEFYNWLHTRYFPWKYTSANRLASTRKSLERHRYDFSEIASIKRQLFSFDRNNIAAGLQIAQRIHGLGPAGASGLLAILFPRWFGTVDTFAAKELDRLPEYQHLMPTENSSGEMSISPTVAAIIIRVYRDQAEVLNRRFGTEEWTPRKIDMVLWALRSDHDDVQRRLSTSVSPTMSHAGYQTANRKAIGAKQWIRNRIAETGEFILADGLAAGYTEITLKTALSDLKNPKYCGTGGVLILQRTPDGSYRPA